MRIILQAVDLPVRPQKAGKSSCATRRGHGTLGPLSPSTPAGRGRSTPVADVPTRVWHSRPNAPLVQSRLIHLLPSLTSIRPYRGSYPRRNVTRATNSPP